jgi:hypothetical protein
VWSTYVGCTRERETGETRKSRGDTGGKARGKCPDLVDVGIAAGGRIPVIHLCRGVGARDRIQNGTGLTVPLPLRRPTMTLLCPSMDKAVEMEGVGGSHGSPALVPGWVDGGGSLGGRR